MKLCACEEAIIQILQDAGCDGKTIAAFLEGMREGREAESLRLLKKQRSLLLEAVHREEEKISRLDYLLYQMKKAKNGKGFSA